MKKKSDALLLLMWGQGDTDAGDEFIRRHGAIITSIRSSFKVPSEADRDDLMSVGFEAMCKAARDYDPRLSDAKPSTYVWKKTYGEMLNWINRRISSHGEHEVSVGEIISLISDQKGKKPVRRSDGFSDAVDLKIDLSRLPDHQRLPVLLRLTGMTWADVASIVGKCSRVAKEHARDGARKLVSSE